MKRIKNTRKKKPRNIPVCVGVTQVIFKILTFVIVRAYGGIIKNQLQKLKKSDLHKTASTEFWLQYAVEKKSDFQIRIKNSAESFSVLIKHQCKAHWIWKVEIFMGNGLNANTIGR